jgi:hypothetical protein
MIDFPALAQFAVLPVDCHHDTNGTGQQPVAPVVNVIDNFPPIPPK